MLEKLTIFSILFLKEERVHLMLKYSKYKFHQEFEKYNVIFNDMPARRGVNVIKRNDMQKCYHPIL